MNNILNEIPAPIFLLGTQRSGTTLLTRMLSSHPQIFIQNEICIPHVFAPNNTKDDTLENLKRQLSNALKQPLSEFLDKENKSVWGIKDPQLTEHIDLLRAFLPESKFIIIVRDARAVVNSYMENKWGLGTNAYTGAQRWLQEVKLQKAFMEEMPKNFHLLRFEDLIDDMEAELVKICRFLGVDFNRDMLKYHQSKVLYEQNKQNINTNKKPEKSISNKWLKKLTPREINIIEDIAKDELLAHKYELKGTSIKLTNLAKSWFYLHQAVLGELQIQFQTKKFYIKFKWKKFFQDK